MPDRGNQISVLMVNNLKLAVFMFKMVEQFSRTCNRRPVDSTSVLKYQHQFKLEQKKSHYIEAPKADKNNWAKMMKNIVLHLKLMREVTGVLLAYMVWHIIKVAHIPPGHEEEMIARAPMVNAELNIKMTQETLERVYLNYQCDTFKIDNALVYQLLTMIFMNTNA